MLLQLCDSAESPGKGSALQKQEALQIQPCLKQPPYLFKWSKRKRNVTRLGSGSDNNKFNMQLSFATGSESAARQKTTEHHHRQGTRT